jgi:lysophospholipase L1-like esterase
MFLRTNILIVLFLITIIAFIQIKATCGQKVLYNESSSKHCPSSTQLNLLFTTPYKIVIVGSSTAFGIGAYPIDSSWARKFSAYFCANHLPIQVINLASLGLTSWDVCPTGTKVHVPFSVDKDRNITKALAFNPDAIILNLPSNDFAYGISTANIHQNFMNIVIAATARNVPVWVTTTQPRNGLSPYERLLQAELKDWIKLTFGNKSVDFWTDISNPDNTINTIYDSGDGVHLNNDGHDILFTRIIEEKILDSICIRKGVPIITKDRGDAVSIPINRKSITLNKTYSLHSTISMIRDSCGKTPTTTSRGKLSSENISVNSIYSFSIHNYKHQNINEVKKIHM